MPKSRKKKVKYQDFAKVKLKVGKKLPRAANETDASFQSRTIQFRDQFKSDEATQGPHTSRKKLNLSDILTQFRHYRSGCRHDALTKLRELISTTPQIINNNLGDITERCSELFADKDKANRSAVLLLLKIIFPKVSITLVTPFFPVLLAHLCCAMTNIAEEIQIDSLRFLDVILDYYPELVIANANQLLQNVPIQLSKQITGGLGNEKNKAAEPVIINPSGKFGSKWQIDILEKLNKVLVDARNRETQKDPAASSDVKDVKWTADMCGMQLYSHHSWYTTVYSLRNHGQE